MAWDQYSRSLLFLETETPALSPAMDSSNAAAWSG